MFSMKQGHAVLILTSPKFYQAQPNLKELGTEFCPQRALLLFSILPSAFTQHLMITGCLPNQTATSQPAADTQSTCLQLPNPL